MALRTGTAIAGAVLLALAPAAVLAQDATTTDQVASDADVGDGNQESGDGGYWGLLGLLGLLAPLFNKKNDDVHVNRTTTTSNH
ncbi:MAG TPA: hypothetical protein VEZ48_14580 [Sphingomonadaceae bacterium]|jgi:hypothetical protein|nr:hypothetical protein [Sphingomonadaceae bacterium]